MKYYEDPILGKGRAADVTGGTGGGGGTEYIGGFAIGISGDTISRLRYMSIESVTGNSVTLQAGHAYKAYATSTAITLNTETVPEGQFGMEGHIEIYVAGAGYVVTGTNVVLANALEPDSVNNCTLRFHDGVCIISVEDHVAGYIVVNGATSGEGSLAYGISTSTNDYVAFDASLNGQVIPLAGAVAEGEKHLVGNGYTSTTLTGNINCGTSKFTVANLALSNVQVTGGTMTLGDAFIPSGSTVAVSGGGVAVERVSGNGGVIDLEQKTVYVFDSVANIMGCEIRNGAGTSGGALRVQNSSVYGKPTDATISSATITGCSASYAGGALFVYGGTATATLNSCTISGCSAQFGGGIFENSGAKTTLNSCVISGCSAGEGGGVCLYNVGTSATLNSCTISGCSANGGAALKAATNAKIELVDCTISGNIPTSRGVNLTSSTLSFAGSNVLTDAVYGSSGSVTISSGAILDLTGNTNATPVAPGGGVIVDDGCQVITSAGSTVSIAGGTYTKINNDGTTE